MADRCASTRIWASRAWSASPAIVTSSAISISTRTRRRRRSSRPSSTSSRRVSRRKSSCSPPEDSKIDWLLGGYFFTAKYAYTPLRIEGFAAAPFTTTDLFGSQKTKSYSAYGAGDVPIFDAYQAHASACAIPMRIRIPTGSVESGGVLILPDHSRRSQSFDKLTWRAAIDQQFTPTISSAIFPTIAASRAAAST